MTDELAAYSGTGARFPSLGIAMGRRVLTALRVVFHLSESAAVRLPARAEVSIETVASGVTTPASSDIRSYSPYLATRQRERLLNTMMKSSLGTTQSMHSASLECPPRSRRLTANAHAGRPNPRGMSAHWDQLAGSV